MKKSISTNNAPQAIGPYSQAIKTNGLIFCSGQIPLKPDGEMVEGGIEEQTKQVMSNLEAVLKASGSGFSKVVKTTVYLMNLNDFTAVNQIYEQYFKEDPPARATVQVAGLPKGAKVEIDAVAIIK